MGGRGGWGLRILDAKTHCVAGRRLGFFSLAKGRAGRRASLGAKRYDAEIDFGRRQTDSLAGPRRPLKSLAWSSPAPEF